MVKRWSWLGDHFALDVANTVQLRHGSYVDLLATAVDLLEWVVRQEQRLPAGPTEPPSAAELGRFIEVRDHVLELLRAAASGAALPERSVAAINAVAVATPTLRLLTSAGDVRTELALPRHPVTDLIGLAAAAVVDLLTGTDRDRLALCPAPSCGQLYLQQRTNQAWCSTSCGNRARSARHYAAERENQQTRRPA